MKFKIPTNLGDLTAAAITRLRGEAAAEYNELFVAAKASPETATSQQVDELHALRAFVADADARLTALAAESDTDGSGTSNDLTDLSPITDTKTSGAGAGDGAEAVDVDGGEDIKPTTVTVGDVAAAGLLAGTAGEVVDKALAKASLIASAGLPDHAAGAEIDGIGALGIAVAKQLDAYVGLGHGDQSMAHQLAAIKLPGSEFAVNGDRLDDEVLKRAVDEKRLPGGSLVAARTQAFTQHDGKLESLTASGWCAPSEIDYSVQFNGAATGLYDVPTVTATRGGLWVMPEISFADAIGMAPAPGSNFFRLTEAQLIAGSTKTFFTLDCPTPVEYRLGVNGVGIITNLLQARAFPEYVAEFIRAAMIGLQSVRAAAKLAAVRAASVLYDLSAVAPWVNDGTVVSQVLSAAEMAAVDQRTRGALGTNATIEQVFPIWLLTQMRADWIRRNATADPELADAWIMGWFARRNIAPQFVYSWQDRYDATDGGLLYPGGNPGVVGERMTALPTSVLFLSYPAGTWVEAVSDVITLRSVYDSVRLASNEKIELFTEQGSRMVPRRNDSRVYKLGICPSGSTGVQRAVACTTGG